MMEIGYEPRAADAPAATPTRGLGRAVLLALLAVSLLQLLLSHLNGDAPLRRDFGRSTDAARNAASAARLINPLVRLAGGRNLAVHFVPTRDATYASTNVRCGLYFALNYALYPARAIVGNGRAVINDGDTLRAADAVQTDAWLWAHGVSAALTFEADRSHIGTAVHPVSPTPTTRP